MTDKQDKVESPSEARERRTGEIRRIVSNEIPRSSAQVSYAFVSRRFVEAATLPYRKCK